METRRLTAWIMRLELKLRTFGQRHTDLFRTWSGQLAKAVDWTDYQISACFTPHLCKAGGIAVRVQGSYYAFICIWKV